MREDAEWAFFLSIHSLFRSYLTVTLPARIRVGDKLIGL
jgi:hypothetical protein